MKNHIPGFQNLSGTVCHPCTSSHNKFQPWRWPGRSFSTHFSDFMGGCPPHGMLIFSMFSMGGTTPSFGKGQFPSNLSKFSGSTIDHAFVKFFWSNIFPTFFDKFGKHLMGVYPWGYTPGLNPCAKERMPNLRGGCPPMETCQAVTLESVFFSRH